MRSVASSALDTVLGSPIAITLVIVLSGFVFGWVLVRFLRALLARLAKGTTATWDDRLVSALSPSVSILIALIAIRVALVWSPLEPRVLEVSRSAIGLLTIFVIVWGVYRAIDLLRVVLETRPWARERPASRSLIALGSRVLKVTAFVFAILVALSQLGVSIASLIAGLGIGGLVIALAAQKTVENLFGTVSIGIDQPMREGDFVKIYDFVGTVEQIGLRSTRIRTLDRTIVTIPNGELSNQRIESYTVRDRIRLAAMIGLGYSTTASQLREVIADLEHILRTHPKIWPDTVVVRFQKFGDSSLDLEIMAWFSTSDWNEFQLIRQEVLIEFMQAIERRGTSIAFPTRTIHVETMTSRPAHAELPAHA
jgi:MscS family membrane protein